MFKILNKIRMYALCVVLVSVAALTGCASNVGDTSNAEYKKIVVGSDRYEPYIYLNDDGDYSGIDVEIATEAFHRMGYEPVFKRIAWEDKKGFLDRGDVDCIWSCFSMNGREDDYQWAGPYLFSRQVVVVRSDSDIQEISDLNGKDVAVQETSKAEEYLLSRLDEKVPNVKRVYAFSNMDDVYGALRKNYVSAVCGHEGVLGTLVKAAPEEYKMLDESLLLSNLGVAFSKDYDSEFVSRLEMIINKMNRDGTTARIVEKYGIDTEKAMSEVMK